MIKRSQFVTLVAVLTLPTASIAQDAAKAADASDVESDPSLVSVDPAEQSVPVADDINNDDPISVDPITVDPITVDSSAVDEGTGETAVDAAEPGELEVLADVPADPMPGASDEERLFAEFDRYRRLVQQGTLDEADVAAKRIVELAIRVYGPQSRETANALNNLGIVQHSNGQFDAAIQNFTSSVEIIEAVEDRLNDALVNPLKGLGAAQMGIGRPDQAKKTYRRAAHITEVNEGPHNLDQVEILELMAEADIRMGNVKSARSTLDRIHLINVKHFEKNPLGLLPSLMSRADWQHRAGYYAEERTTYRRAIRIVETSAGKSDPMLVEPLRRLGESFYFVDVNTSGPHQQGLLSTGELYFKRAARIADKADGMPWKERARAALALADYYTYIDTQNRAKKIYRDIWEMLDASDETRMQRDEWFGHPTPLREVPLPNFTGSAPLGNEAPGDIATGRVVVDYTVSSRGRVRDLRTEVFPEEFTDIQRMVHREIRSRIHRPRFVDGSPVDVPELRFEHEFSYRQAELDALKKAADAKDAQASNRK